MGLFDRFREVFDEVSSSSNSNYHKRCEKCNSFCKHTIVGITITFQPIVNSIETCTKCGAKKQFDGERWHWIN